jgi:hypothetical protein
MGLLDRIYATLLLFTGIQCAVAAGTDRNWSWWDLGAGVSLGVFVSMMAPKRRQRTDWTAFRSAWGRLGEVAKQERRDKISKSREGNGTGMRSLYNGTGPLPSRMPEDPFNLRSRDGLS